MADKRQEQLEQLLLGLLPLDGSTVGNGQLLTRWTQAAASAGEAVTEADFTTVRQALLARQMVVKGKGRGGSTARASAAVPGSEAFALQVEAPVEGADEPAATPRKTKAAKPKATAADDGTAQVISYRHTDKRKNNPEVGLVNEASDPQQPKKTWAYNPHLDPVLNFDSSRAELENQVADALASGDAAVMKAALEEIQRRGAPYLQWAGKAERTSFEVDTVSLHVHERIDPMSILSAVRKNAGGGPGTKNAKPADEAKLRQASLFEAPFENLPLRDAVDFYRHDKGWANRLVSGDSLQVMNSLLVKEGMAGQVQMVYIDPPYGIKYGSNFQPFVGKRDVKDKSDADLTQEPEMIKAFRDTWELGVHSYLSYLRDRLLLARELLTESGSVFVQISDENLHHVTEVMNEVFGSGNYVAVVTFKKTSGAGSPSGGTQVLAKVSDYLIWYAKDASKVKYQQLYKEKAVDGAGGSGYSMIQLRTGARRRLSAGDGSEGVFTPDNLTSQSSGGPQIFEHTFCGQEFSPHRSGWKTTVDGLARLDKSGRLFAAGNTLRYVRFLDDFAAFPINGLWDDTTTAGFGDPKTYVVQTNSKVIERCMLMTSDPGDLVLDITCGSGSTAAVAEKWGRRWITCDTSRVAITLAKQRLMTASFDYYELAYPHEGLKGGFIYKTVPHITLKSIANGNPPETHRAEK